MEATEADVDSTPSTLHPRRLMTCAHDISRRMSSRHRNTCALATRAGTKGGLATPTAGLLTRTKHWPKQVSNDIGEFTVFGRNDTRDALPRQNHHTCVKTVRSGSRVDTARRAPNIKCCRLNSLFTELLTHTR